MTDGFPTREDVILALMAAHHEWMSEANPEDRQRSLIEHLVDQVVAPLVVQAMLIKPSGAGYPCGQCGSVMEMAKPAVFAVCWDPDAHVVRERAQLICAPCCASLNQTDDVPKPVQDTQNVINGSVSGSITQARDISGAVWM
jgi:hypothetical protein